MEQTIYAPTTGFRADRDATMRPTTGFRADRDAKMRPFLGVKF